MHAWRAARHDNNKFVPCSYVALHTQCTVFNEWRHLHNLRKKAQQRARVRPALFVAKRNSLSTAERNVQVFKALRPLYSWGHVLKDATWFRSFITCAWKPDYNWVLTWINWKQIDEFVRHSEFLREDCLNVMRTELNCKWKQNNTCQEAMQVVYIICI